MKPLSTIVALSVFAFFAVGCSPSASNESDEAGMGDLNAPAVETLDESTSGEVSESGEASESESESVYSNNNAADDESASWKTEEDSPAIATLDEEESAPSEPETAEEFMQAINEQLASQDIEGAIQVAEQAHSKFPEDTQFFRGYCALLYNSIPELDEAAARDRREKLGNLMRELVALSQAKGEDLGEMPQVVMLGEAEAYAKSGEHEKAWQTLKEMQSDFGPISPSIISALYMQPDFEAVMKMEEAQKALAEWSKPIAEQELAAHEPYAFDFASKSFDDGSEIASADYQGKLLIVDVWGTWCPPCREEIPQIISLLDKRGEDISVVGLTIEDPRTFSIDFESAKAQVEEFEKTGIEIPYPCVMGTQEDLSKIKNFQGFPTLLFIDRQGMVRATMVGFHPLPVLEAVLDSLMEKDPAKS